MRGVEWALILVLVIAGLYFLVVHKDPWPLNHEAIGLGMMHTLHSAVGIVLIGLAGVVGWRAWRAQRTRTPM